MPPRDVSLGKLSHVGPCLWARGLHLSADIFWQAPPAFLCLFGHVSETVAQECLFPGAPHVARQSYLPSKDTHLQKPFPFYEKKLSFASRQNICPPRCMDQPCWPMPLSGTSKGVSRHASTIAVASDALNCILSLPCYHNWHHISKYTMPS